MKGLNSKCVLMGMCLLLFCQQSMALGQPFSSQELLKVKQQWHGKNWVMLLWSIDCPPCFKELGLIQQLKQHNPDLPVLLINVDDYEESMEERNQIIAQFELQDMHNLYFDEGEAARSRFAIDPQWGGELPRSYFVDSQGKTFGRSGLVNKSILHKWLLLSNPESLAGTIQH